MGDDLYGLVEMDLKLWSPGSEELYFKTISRKEKLSDSDYAGLAKNVGALHATPLQNMKIESHLAV